MRGDHPAACAARGAYIPAVDGLRAVAVLAVMLFHLRPGRLPGGYAGVDIFFVISGFVVARSLIAQPAQTLPMFLAGFYARRIVRLLPALALMLVTVTLFSILFIPNVGVMTDTRAIALGAAAGAANLVLAFTDANYFAPSADYQPFLHSWTLGVEEQFYLVCPLAIWLWLRAPDTGRRGVLLTIALLGVGSLLLCIGLRAPAPRLAFYLMPSRFWALALGTCLGMASEAGRTRVAALPRSALAMLMLFAVALLALAMLFPDPAGWVRSSVLAAASSGMLILLVTARPRLRLSQLLATAPMLWIGLRSYPLYLWHWPVFVLFRWTIGIDTALAAAAAIVLTFALAAASYAFVERPVRSLKDRAVAAPGRVIVAGIGLAMICAAAILLLFSQEGGLTLSQMHHSRIFKDLKPPGCALRSESRPVAGGTMLAWTPLCAGRSNGGRLFVVGDSHARAAGSLARRDAAARRVTAIILHREGCEFPRIARLTRDTGACRAFRRGAAALLVRDVKRGDVLLMESLRLPRLAPGYRAWRADDAGADWRQDEHEVLAALRLLSAKGVMLVFEAPKPVLPSVPYRCSDWFNRANPDCRAGLEIARNAVERQRAAILRELHALAGGLPNARIFDPLPILCPAARCGAVLGGTILFFDGDHVTDAANARLFPAFEAALAADRVTDRSTPSRTHP
ncbi:acyltransferase family protein [Sphingosinicella sp. BN140058]|uniref:acyltransferase family protein n=1 Tax=Sphingosinicella sp. BN140058 TaxID=1892855 RepID=UPI001011B099|nr:acyltransferase family protein [Sphingosinicella sp. BN140058]QAY75108.1 acyltransferase [Sphingosinicella sp. BN140058]